MDVAPWIWHILPCMKSKKPVMGGQWSFIFHIGNIWGKNVYSISIFIKYLPSFFISLSILSFYETVTASCFWQWRIQCKKRQKVFYKKTRTLLNKLLNRIKIEKWWGYSVKKSRTLLKKVLNIINIEKCKRTSTRFLKEKLHISDPF